MLPTANKVSFAVTARLGHQSLAEHGRDSEDSRDYDQSDAAKSGSAIFASTLLGSDARGDDGVGPQNGYTLVHGADDVIKETPSSQQLDWV